LITFAYPFQPDGQNPFWFAGQLVHLKEIHERPAGRAFRQLRREEFA
jgi:hypothetical protein